MSEKILFDNILGRLREKKESDDSIRFDEPQNLTDEQRITALANVSNQTANTNTGRMGYKVLMPGVPFASQVTEPNTIYEIRDVFDLGGTEAEPVTVTMPSGSVLKNSGGLLKNCNIELSNTGIESSTPIFGEGVTITGKPLQDASPEWFTGSDADKIERAIECFSSIRLAPRTYEIDRQILISQSFAIRGSGYGEFFGGQYPPQSVNGKCSILKVNGSFDSIIYVVGRGSDNIPQGYTPKKKFVSALISGVCFAAFSGVTGYRSVNGINWSTPGGPSRPVEICNCSFTGLKWAFFSAGSISGTSTNVGNLYIVECVISGCHWGIVASGRGSIGNLTIQTCLIEGNHTNEKGIDEFSNYELLTDETAPDDWETDYMNYYTKVGNEYVQVPEQDPIPTYEPNMYYQGGAHYIDGGAIWAYNENGEYLGGFTNCFVGELSIKNCNIEGNPKCLDIIGSALSVIMEGNYFEYRFGQRVIVKSSSASYLNNYMYIDNDCLTHAGKVTYELSNLTVEFGTNNGRTTSNRYKLRNCYLKNAITGRVVNTELAFCDYDDKDNITICDEADIVARIQSATTSASISWPKIIDTQVNGYPCFANLTKKNSQRVNVSVPTNCRLVFYAFVKNSTNQASINSTNLFDKRFYFKGGTNGKLMLFNIDVNEGIKEWKNLLLDTVNDGIFIVSKPILVSANNAGGKLVGYDLSKEVGLKDNILNMPIGFPWIDGVVSSRYERLVAMPLGFDVNETVAKQNEVEIQNTFNGGDLLYIEVANTGTTINTTIITVTFYNNTETESVQVTDFKNVGVSGAAKATCYFECPDSSIFTKIVFVNGESSVVTTFKVAKTQKFRRFVKDDGFTLAERIGQTSNRPTGIHQVENDNVLSYEGDLYPDLDIGYPYYDTDLDKMVYAAVINETTGIVTWTNADGSSLTSYTVDTTGVGLNLTIDNATDANKTYLATLTADTGYELGAVSVTMGGTDITAQVFEKSTGVIYIASVTGNIVITATATATAD